MHGFQFRKRIGAATACLLLTFGVQSVQAQENVVSQGPVVVELFTSQGCSSCPPADSLLHQLTEYDDILPLALHVDYWDYIGWKDEFADPAHAHRQRAYAHVAGRNMIYTPQMVVMGQEDIVGADGVALMSAIEQHKGYESPVSLGIQVRGDSYIAVLDGETEGGAELFLVRYSPSRSVDILRGELAGHSLTYANVVESVDKIGHWSGEAVGEISFQYQQKNGEEAAVLLQKPGYGSILLARRLP